MKYFYLVILLLLVPIGARAANPSFLSFEQPGSGFTVHQPYIYASGTNSGSTNIYVDARVIYTNTTIQYLSTTNYYDERSYVIYTNTSVTLNGTNLATINPTIGRVPYNADGTNFLDSALYYVDPNTVGANQLHTDLMVFNPAPTQALSTGVNLLNPFEVSYMPLTATTTTATDTQIRLSTGNGVGSLLVIQNYDDHAFELLNGDELWDDPTAHLYLSGGDWTPTALGESILLIGNSVGWAEIGRFGGSTNVVTESLWQYSGGYLQPINLTQPLFWTNSVHWGDATHVIGRSGHDLFYTNDQSTANLGVLNTSGVGVELQAQSGSAVGIVSAGSPSSLFLRNGTDQLALSGSRWSPIVDLGIALGDVTGPRWGDIASGGTVYVGGFLGAAVTNYSRGAISHTGTNGVWLFDSQGAGIAGAARKIQFDMGGTNLYEFGSSPTAPYILTTESTGGKRITAAVNSTTGSLTTTAASLILGVTGVQNIQITTGAVTPNASDAIDFGVPGTPFKSIYLGHNVGFYQTTGDATFVDVTVGSQTNQVTGAIAFGYATNGVNGIDATHTRWLINGSGSDQTFSIPSGWKTNFVSAVPAALTNGVITLMTVRSHGLTLSAAMQTNCLVSFEYYK